MRKIVLEVKESLYDRLVCLALSNEKSISQLILELFDKDIKAQTLHDEMYQVAFENLTKEERVYERD